MSFVGDGRDEIPRVELCEYLAEPFEVAISAGDVPVKGMSEDFIVDVGLAEREEAGVNLLETEHSGEAYDSIMMCTS